MIVVEAAVERTVTLPWAALAAVVSTTRKLLSNLSALMVRRPVPALKLVETLLSTMRCSRLSTVMAPGALDPLVKELIYLAVSTANGCSYCIHSHTASARAKGMTDAEHRELLAIIGMASETNRLVTALGAPIDDVYDAG